MGLGSASGEHENVKPEFRSRSQNENGLKNSDAPFAHAQYNYAKMEIDKNVSSIV